MGGKPHPLGWCTCKKSNGRHWTAEEVDYLERNYGLMTDAAIAKHLGRSLDVKAGKLRLRKRQSGFTGRDVAAIFGVDDHVPGRWVKLGLMRARRAAFKQGPNPVLLFRPGEVDRFIKAHPEYVDVDKMPDSWYRDLALRDRWYDLPAVERLTGHDTGSLTRAVRAGVYTGRKRYGTRWMVPASELPRIAAATTRWRRSHIDLYQQKRTQRLRQRKLRRVREEAA